MATRPNRKGDDMSLQTAVKPSRKVLAEVSGFNLEEIKDDSRLGLDLKIGDARFMAADQEMRDLWWRIEKVYKIPIPEEMRPTRNELREKTAAQFDAIIKALTGNSEPVGDESPASTCSPAVAGDGAM